MAGKITIGDGPGRHWQEIDAEGRHYQLHGKLPIALKTLNKAAECLSGCGWRIFAHRAECHLHLLDSAAALQDASQAMDMQRSCGGQGAPSMGVLETACEALWREAELEEALVVVARMCARKKGRKLVGDAHALKMEGIRGDVGKALGPSVGRVLRRDLLRSMMIRKGIDPKHPMSGPRHSWVGPGYGAPDPAWRVRVGAKHAKQSSDEVPLPLPLSWGAAKWRREEQREGEDEEQESLGDDQDDSRRWGWMRQIPGHDHVCADPVIAEQADRIAEARELGLLERDRAYLLYLLDQLKVDMERPGESVQVESDCKPCPGPNLEKWRDEQLRADASDAYCDPLAASKWAAQDACKKSLDDLNNFAANRLRVRGRYQHRPAGRGPSSRLRETRTNTRCERASSTVRSMLSRLQGCLRAEQYRDADGVAERLAAFLERLPCKIFPDRFHALARTLDCRAVAARRRGNTSLAVEMQKRRCQLAVDHGIPEMYARALDELALLLFSMSDYQQAEASWTERVSLRSENLLEKAQTVFQLARCCFVQGHLRLLGKVQATSGSFSAIRHDHRQEVPKYSMGSPSRRANLLSIRSSKTSKSSRSLPSTAGSSGTGHLYPWKASDGNEWSPDMYCGGSCPSLRGEDEEDEDEEEEGEVPVQVKPTPSELKPTSVEACLLIIMQDLDTKDPLRDHGDLLCMERFPDPGDAQREYKLMPADFNPASNVMNAEFELFEKRFREACQSIVSNMTSTEATPAAPALERDITQSTAADESSQSLTPQDGVTEPLHTSIPPEGSLDHIPEEEAESDERVTRHDQENNAAHE